MISGCVELHQLGITSGIWRQTQTWIIVLPGFVIVKDDENLNTNQKKKKQYTEILQKIYLKKALGNDWMSNRKKKYLTLQRSEKNNVIHPLIDNSDW